MSGALPANLVVRKAHGENRQSRGSTGLPHDRLPLLHGGRLLLGRAREVLGRHAGKLPFAATVARGVGDTQLRSHALAQEVAAGHRAIRLKAFEIGVVGRLPIDPHAVPGLIHDDGADFVKLRRVAGTTDQLGVEGIVGIDRVCPYESTESLCSFVKLDVRRKHED